tara:strand:+ start:868 stop:1179 length:312 start_codon:yes stop_codon:yes gene_type:complete
MSNLRNNQVEVREEELAPEIKLWKAVMATAIYDALHTPKTTRKGKYKVYTEISDTEEARYWFKTKEGTFGTVCEALDIDSDRVHKIMTSKIRQKQFQERLAKI